MIDYSCALQDLVLWFGRLYVSSHYICFYSEILGRQTKIVLKSNEVQDVKKRTTLGFFQSGGIKITTKDGRVFRLRSFYHREKAYQVLCAVTNPKREFHRTGSASKLRATINDVYDLELEDGEENHHHRNDGLPHDDDSEDSDGNEMHQDMLLQQLEPSISAYVDEEEKEEEEAKLGREAYLNEDSVRHVPPLIKSQSIRNHFDSLFGDVTMKEIVRKSLPVSIDVFFRMFFANRCYFGFDDFHLSEGNWEIELTKWNEAPDFGCVRDLSFRSAIVGAPPWVAKSTRIHKVQRYRYMDANTLLIDVDTLSMDVPYGTSFHTVDKIEVNTLYSEKGDKHCEVVFSSGVRFVKSIRTPGVKSIIRSHSRAETQKCYESWLTHLSDGCQAFLNNGKVIPHAARREEDGLEGHNEEDKSSVSSSSEEAENSLSLADSTSMSVSVAEGKGGEESPEQLARRKAVEMKQPISSNNDTANGPGNNSEAAAPRLGEREGFGQEAGAAGADPLGNKRTQITEDTSVTEPGAVDKAVSFLSDMTLLHWLLVVVIILQLFVLRSCSMNCAAQQQQTFSGGSAFSVQDAMRPVAHEL